MAYSVEKLAVYVADLASAGSTDVMLAGLFSSWRAHLRITPVLRVRQDRGRGGRTQPLGHAPQILRYSRE
ncbi:MAG TPA: hypothetical protein VEN79_07870, partial [Terriglobia bacterium]|nr:hypothetical protein [Terriglobia bacterium]